MHERQAPRNVAVGIVAAMLAGALLAGLGPARAEPPELDTLLKRIALKGAGEVAFEERRFLGALTTPLLSRGHLRYEPPDRLIKKVESPRRETAVAEKDRLAVLNEDGVETASIDLGRNADLRLVFDGLRGVLSGDPEALRAVFETRLAGDGKDWRIELAPKGAAGDTRIKQIVVTGSADRIARFEIHERGGDRSLIQLLDAPPRS